MGDVFQKYVWYTEMGFYPVADIIADGSAGFVLAAKMIGNIYIQETLLTQNEKQTVL